MGCDDCVVVDETQLGTYQLIARSTSASVIVDEPTSVGGLASGPNPYELLCGALGSCTLMTVRMYARRKDWPLLRARVSVVHRREDDREVYEKHVELIGELDASQRTRLLEIAGKCPVHRTLEQSALIRTSLAEAPHQPATSAQHTTDISSATAGS